MTNTLKTYSRKMREEKELSARRFLHSDSLESHGNQTC